MSSEQAAWASSPQLSALVPAEEVAVASVAKEEQEELVVLLENVEVGGGRGEGLIIQSI